MTQYSPLFAEVSELFDTFLPRCGPFARVVQTLSLDASREYYLTCNYGETYYPLKGYSSGIKVGPSVIGVSSPMNFSLTCRMIFFGFDKNNSNHQYSLASSLEKLKTKLIELGREPKYTNNLMSYWSSEPFNFEEAGVEFIKKQLGSIPLYRESARNLLNQGFQKDLLLEIPKSEYTDTYRFYAFLAFLVNEPNRKHLFDLRAWEGFRLEKEELKKLKEIIGKYKFEISVDDYYRDIHHKNVSIEELEKMCNVIQK